MNMKSPIDCVGIICVREDEVLMIQRGTAPRKGEWSIPGGRIEKGETEQQACLRELFEETSITAHIGPKIATIPAHFEGKDYWLNDYLALWQSGTPTAGDDAADCAFIPITDVAKMDLWEKTRQIILRGHALYKEHGFSSLVELGCDYDLL